jgi:alpha-ketoglutarate-dependent sulfate ester dioxygenase
MAMSSLTLNKLTENVGVEVIGLDADRLLHDDSVPDQILAALEDNGVLVFPKLNLDAETQAAVCLRLGDVDFSVGSGAVRGIMLVTLDPSKSRTAEYLRGTFSWHIDGCTLPEGQNPQAATVLSAVALAESGGQTEFASTYGAYDALTAEEKERYGNLRVHHTIRATQRLVTPNPTSKQEASWAGGLVREHPLVWRHRSGRRSLVIGATTESVVGMDAPAGRLLLDEILERATAPETVYRHEWSLGDAVIWDNRGVLHRVEPYDSDSPREMIRTSLLGGEPIE